MKTVGQCPRCGSKEMECHGEYNSGEGGYDYNLDPIPWEEVKWEHICSVCGCKITATSFRPDDAGKFLCPISSCKNQI